MWSAYLFVAALAVQLETGEAADMRSRDASVCVDPASFKSCRQRTRDSRTDCVSQRCYGTEDPCTKVYSCEYGMTVSGLVYSCPDVNLDQIPFCPPPDNAPGGCVCNVGKAEACLNNGTKLGQLSTAKERTDYWQACLVWDTCPNTNPVLNTADYWGKYLLGPHDWDAFTPYLQQYDCAGMLGFGAAGAGGTQNFYEPGKIPKHGTGLLMNTGGVISTPVSGSSFTWTFGSTTHPITAVVNSTATRSATGECTGTACRGAQKTGGGESIAAVQSRPGILVAGTLIGLWAAWVGFCM
ncbi:hypothetical protein BDV38DRAFT_290150 [Aspergillus pseudotamarii]|uniref:Uncharacterized protein n=1 Tax=Aspergillus pseudotamarii TaxID=132259 RepID=A0A5N6T2A7_ASPPS|nr:uncharacterized protein BDV38DRAFT_290150 [Aspergillus pseudotamarii]KAE8140421.1 hypothetical protein BDV38DRAFT_290150 [Aspergillus pseudotamarii]